MAQWSKHPPEEALVGPGSDPALVKNFFALRMPNRAHSDMIYNFKILETPQLATTCIGAHP